MNRLALQLLADIGPLSQQVVPTLATLLRGSVHIVTRNAILRALAAHGTVGISYILSVLEDGMTDRDYDVINGLASIPSIQKVIIVPMLLEELKANNHSRQIAALLALGSMYSMAYSADMLATLETMLTDGLVKWKLTAYVIRALGKAGEISLCRMCLDQRNSEGVREAAAWALGIQLPAKQIAARFRVNRSAPGIIFNNTIPFYVTTSVDMTNRKKLLAINELLSYDVVKFNDLNIVLEPRAFITFLQRTLDLYPTIQIDAPFDLGQSSTWMADTQECTIPSDNGDGYATPPRKSCSERLCHLGSSLRPNEEGSQILHEIMLSDLSQMNWDSPNKHARYNMVVEDKQHGADISEYQIYFAKTPERNIEGLKNISNNIATMPLNFKVMQTLVLSLNDEMPRVRQASALSLGRCGKLGAEVAFGALHSQLHDKDPFVREACASAIGSLGLHVTSKCDEILASLKDCIHDSFWRVRYASVNALRCLGEFAAPAIPALSQAMRIGALSRNTLASTIAALGSLGIKELLGILCSQEEAYKNSVRASAAYGLVSVAHAQL